MDSHIEENTNQASKEANKEEDGEEELTFEQFLIYQARVGEIDEV